MATSPKKCTWNLLQVIHILHHKFANFTVLYIVLNKLHVRCLLSLVLRKLFISSSSFDHGLFIQKTEAGITLLLLYVDNMIITRDENYGISNHKQFLSHNFEIKDLGLHNYFLGMKIFSDYYLFHAKYASDILARAGLTDCKTASTPIETNLNLTPWWYLS